MTVLIKPFILITIMLCIGNTSNGQQIKQTAIDSLLELTFKENKKCKMVIKGTRSTGTAYYYLKKNGNLFMVQSRRQFKTGKKLDSSIVYFHYYINDTLVKTIHHRHFDKDDKHCDGNSFLYFKNDAIIEQLQTGSFPPEPDLDSIVKDAYYFVKHSYEIDKRHRFRESSQ